MPNANVNRIAHNAPLGISRRRRAFLAELAESVAEEFSPSPDRVEPDLIARSQQITFSYGNYGRSFDGLLECRNGKFHIFCNLRDRLNRGDGRPRFTMGHELGHFFISEHRVALLSGRAPAHASSCDAPNPENYVEAEADFFASRLILPETRLQRALDHYGRRLDNLLDVARLFGASVEATVRRVVEMPDSLLAMVVFRRDGAPWSRLSPRLAAIGLREIKPVRPDKTRDSATWKAVTARSTTDVFTSTTSAHHWFNGISSGASANIILREEAFKNQFYTLTLLTASKPAVAAIESP